MVRECLLEQASGESFSPLRVEPELLLSLVQPILTLHYFCVSIPAADEEEAQEIQLEDGEQDEETLKLAANVKKSKTSKSPSLPPRKYVSLPPFFAHLFYTLISQVSDIPFWMSAEEKVRLTAKMSCPNLKSKKKSQNPLPSDLNWKNQKRPSQASPQDRQLRKNQL